MKISCDQPRMTVCPGLDHTRAALAQLRELALESRVDDADQRADEEDAEEGHGQHPEQEPERPAVAAHRARVERPHHAVPQQVAQFGVRDGVEDRDQERDQDHPDHRDDEQAQDQGDRPAGHEVVEDVADPLAAGGLGHAILMGGLGR